MSNDQNAKAKAKARNRSLRGWYWVHKWSSLVATIFVLIACVTGLPLIFVHELEDLFSGDSHAVEEPAQTLNFDALIAAAKSAQPSMHTQIVAQEPIDPGVTLVGLGETIDAPLEKATFLRIDNATGVILDAGGAYDGVLGAIAQLHIELFAGQFGTFSSAL